MSDDLHLSRQHWAWRSRIRLLAVASLGVVFPLFMLIQAYAGLASLGTNVGATGAPENLVKTFSEVKQIARDANDYSLFSLLYSEHANQKTMINKQVMKVSIMQLGFAVISLGMMFIVLGINDGGASGSGEGGGIKFDFKSGSTGVVIFLVGATMSTAGGVLKNDYLTVPIPPFAESQSSGNKQSPLYRASLDAFGKCRQPNTAEANACFSDLFQQINEKELK